MHRTVLSVLVLLVAEAVEAASGTIVPLKPPSPLPSVRYVAVDPNHAGTVYAAVYDDFHPTYPYPDATIYKSVDAGATWVDVGAGLPHDGTLVEGIAVDSQSTVYVLASAEFHPLRSTDGGTTWTFTTSDKMVFGANLVVDPATAGTLYAYRYGIVKSTDGGATWSDINTGLGDPLPGDQNLAISTLAIDPRNPSTLYAGRWERGIYKSNDGGANWRLLNLGLQPSGVVSIAVDPNDSRIVFAGTAEDGLFKSGDGGEHWAPVKTGQPNQQVFAVAIDKASTIYAGIYDFGVLASSDGGATWSRADTGMHSAYIVALVPDPSKPGTVYAGCLQ